MIDVLNKLRAFSSATGGTLFALSIWAIIRYGRPSGAIPFVETATLAVLMAVLPSALAHVKLWIYRNRKRLHSDRDGGIRDGTAFVSDAPISDSNAGLSSVAEAFRTDESADAVRREEFSEGEGLRVTHVGGHSSFVRVTDSNRLVVSGTSERTEVLVQILEERMSLSFERFAHSPLLRPRPVRGGSRVLLGVLLAVLFVVGVGGVASAAYPSDAYNTTEKVALVSFDVRADLEPGTTTTDARLGKARFLVRVIDEEAIEIRWERNVTNRVRRHGRQAVRIGDDVCSLLATVRSADLTAEQAATADGIAVDLREAERNVADALADKATHDAVRGDELLHLRERLRAAENATHDEGPSEQTPRSSPGGMCPPRPPKSTASVWTVLG